MRTVVAMAGSVVLAGALVAAAPSRAIDLEQVREMKATARAELLQLRAAAAPAQSNVKSVLVRCDRGESLQAALDRNPTASVVEIRGICTENVRIERRSDLTLRGADPATDGLRGVADPPRDATLELRWGDRIAIENLSFNNGPSAGLGLWFTEATIDNCWFNDNENAGLHVSASSYVRATRLQAARNRYGFNVQRQSNAVFQACDLIDNQWAHTVYSGGFSTLWDGVVSGPAGLYANGAGSYVDVDCYYGPPTTHGCSLTVSNRAGFATAGGTVGFESAPFAGRLVAADGQIVIGGSQQAPLAGGLNTLTGSSQINTAGWEDKAGNPLDAELAQTDLYDYSRATLDPGTVLLDSLWCFEASDALADGVEVAGKVFQCPHVPAGGSP